MDALLAMLQRCDVPVIEGPAKRIGGRSAGTARGMSVYIRDPDQNLLEFICY
jgi:catechol 2,3-dioxygenase-like lactoylglutathione lyase family enzyme